MKTKNVGSPSSRNSGFDREVTTAKPKKRGRPKKVRTTVEIDPEIASLAKKEGSKINRNGNLKRQGRSTSFRFIHVLKAYDCAKQGFSDRAIADAIGINKHVLVRWIRKYSRLRIAIKVGRKKIQTAGTFEKYVYDQLSPKMRIVWDKLMKFHNQGAIQKVEVLLDGKGESVRQAMFIHALVHSNFNASRACSFVNITKQRLLKWQMDDEFAQLLEEIDWHKKNFMEGSLMDLVAAGDKQAIMFVNKTLNRDRGFGNKIEVEHKGAIGHTHQHNVMDFTPVLDRLPVKYKMKVLEVMQEVNKETKEAAENGGQLKLGVKDKDVIDVDFEVVEKAIEEDEDE
jgi:hypothetical protein